MVGPVHFKDRFKPEKHNATRPSVECDDVDGDGDETPNSAGDATLAGPLNSTSPCPGAPCVTQGIGVVLVARVERRWSLTRTATPVTCMMRRWKVIEKPK